MITVKRRVAKELISEVRETLENEEDMEDELIALVRDIGELS
jgi:regulator of sigma D